MTASIAALNADLTAAETELETARKAAQRVAELEANVLRLRAALKHLEAPQTPEGRKRIGKAARGRKAKGSEGEPADAVAFSQTFAAMHE